MTTKNAYQLDFGPSSEAEGGDTVPFTRVFGPADFESDFRWIDLCIIKPGAEINVHGHQIDDEIYFILKGNGVKIVNGEERPVGPGDLVLLRAGGTHGLRNETDQEVHVLVVDLLASLNEDQSFLLRHVDDVPLVIKKAHAGVGTIGVGNFFDPDELGPAWDFVEVVTLPPGSTIGTHKHRGNEEFYYLYQGQGVLIDDGQEIEVGPGAVSICRSGGSHGLRNSGDRTIKLIVGQAPGQSG